MTNTTLMPGTTLGLFARQIYSGNIACSAVSGLVHLCAILGHIGVLVLPNQIAISKANQAFAPPMAT